MRAAVQLLYEHGRRMHAEAREHWGQLEVHLEGRTLVAKLRHMNGNRSVEVLPALYDVHLVRLCDDVLELRGFEKAVGWHLQVWSCRRPTSHEIALAGKWHEALDFDYPRFQRCWSQLLEYAINRAHPAAFIEIGEIMRTLDMRVDDAFRFIEWLCESGHAYSTTAGSSLGSVALKPRPQES
jgi:hypothetical protein